MEILRATGGIPAHLAGMFREALNFQQAKDGVYYVFDRRAHSVYELDPQLTAARAVVQIGGEPGRILEPTAFDLEPGGTFAVADAPNNRERIQFFGPAGLRIGGFTLPGRGAARITMGTLVLNGISTLQFGGRSILMNQPETGALMTEYGLSGTAVRSFGNLRQTGHEPDRDVHLAMNVGLPLLNPKGGFYFVFQTGDPVFRKYDAAGKLLFERLMQGPELDEALKTQPTTWPRGRTRDGLELPIVPPLVRTAAVDPDGYLWVSFTVPYTYVFDPDGDKVRTIQFRAGGTVAPGSLFFPSSERVLVTPGCYEFKTR